MSIKDKIREALKTSYMLVDNVCVGYVHPKFEDLVKEIVDTYVSSRKDIYVVEQVPLKFTITGGRGKTLTTGAKSYPYTERVISYVLISIYEHGINIAYHNRTEVNHSRYSLSDTPQGVLFYSTVDLADRRVVSYGIKVSEAGVKHTPRKCIPLAALDGTPQIVHLKCLEELDLTAINNNYKVAINYIHKEQEVGYLWQPLARHARSYDQYALINTFAEGIDLANKYQPSVTDEYFSEECTPNYDLCPPLAELKLKVTKSIDYIEKYALVDRKSGGLAKDSVAVVNNAAVFLVDDITPLVLKNLADTRDARPVLMYQSVEHLHVIRGMLDTIVSYIKNAYSCAFSHREGKDLTLMYYLLDKVKEELRYVALYIEYVFNLKEIVNT